MSSVVVQKASKGSKNVCISRGSNQTIAQHAESGSTNFCCVSQDGARVTQKSKRGGKNVFIGGSSACVMEASGDGVNECDMED